MLGSARFRSLILFSVFMLFIVGAFASPSYAQFNSGFTGVVVEQSGAVVPGARVSVTNQSNGVSQFTLTSDSGSFRIPSISQGEYTIQVDAKGFKLWTQKDVHLEANEVKTVNPTLALPAQSEVVQVSEAVAAVETDRSDTSRELSQSTIETAPLLGRNVYTSMIQLAPGITGSGMPSGGATGSGSNNNDSFEQEQAYEINASGQRQDSNEYDVDGTSMNSASRDGVVNLAPEPDTIESIRVSGATFDASKGRYSGAWVQVFTKPGSNDFHGSLSEYHTNNDLTARTIFQFCPPDEAGCRAIPAFRRNEFGGTFGGPVLKNKLFFFVSAFGLLSSTATTDVTTVETPQFVNFVEQNFPTNIASTFFKDAPVGNTPPLTNVLTVAQVEQQNPGFYPTTAFPADLPAVGTGFFSQSLTHNAYQWHFRVDYNLTDNDRLFFSMFRTYSNSQTEDPRPIYRVLIPNYGFYAKIDWTHTFAPNLLNEAGFTVHRAIGNNPSAIGHQELPNANITGAGYFSQWGPAGWVHENFNWHDVLTWTHGKHTISGGFDFDRHHDDDNFTSPLLRPTFNFANLIDFAQDGVYSQSGPTVDVSTGQLANNLYQVLRWIYMGMYAQDDWKVTRRVTLNLGLRYDYFGHWGNFHNSTTPMPFFTPGAGSDFAEQVTNGVMEVHSGQNAYVTENRPWGISPRLGFGWDVFGDGKTSVRAGYGLYYNNVADGSWSFPNRANPPTWATPSFGLYNTTHPFTYALGNSQGLGWPVPPISFQTTPAGGIAGIPVTTSGVQPNVDQPRTHVWMLSIQKDLGHNFAFEADYNGSHSDHLYVQTDINRFPDDLILNNGVQTRLNSNFGPILFGRTIGIADGQYGSFMLSKRMSRNWQLRAIYTFGKATDDMSSNDNGSYSNTSEAVFNPLDVASQHGLSDYDVSKRFTADSLVTLPSPFQEGIGNVLLGGWRFSTILVLQSGLPFTVYTSAPFVPICSGAVAPVGGSCPAGSTVVGNAGGDFNADGYDYDAPNRAPAGAGHTGSRSDFIRGFASASAFPTPALGQEGNSGRNAYIGPGMANVNVQFAKEFKWERYSLEFRADMFNIFNRVNLLGQAGGMVTDLSSSLFGQATTQNLPRSFQFGLHLAF
jgi:Carboxypeptidase regulatory-like domain